MTQARPLAAAIRRKDWERAALLLLIGLMEAARKAPQGTIDDVLMLLSAEGDGRGEPQISQIAQIGDDAGPQRAQRAPRGRAGKRRS